LAPRKFVEMHSWFGFIWWRGIYNALRRIRVQNATPMRMIIPIRLRITRIISPPGLDLSVKIRRRKIMRRMIILLKLLLFHKEYMYAF
jgi:hypothetical protein